MKKTIAVPTTFVFIVGFLLFLQLNSGMAVMATNGQATNTQVLQANTSSDFYSWVRQSETTNEPFHFTSPTGFYSYQLNTLLNGCGISSYGCTWWLQGVVYAENHTVSPPAKGAIVDEAFEEEWQATSNLEGTCYPTVDYQNCYNFCWFYPDANINYSGYFVQQESFLHSATQVEYALSIATSSGGNLYSDSQVCNYYSGTGPVYGPVNYFSRVEGVIVGDSNGDHASFSPLSSEIFHGYIDLISTYNQMSSHSEATQTGETSNLYQVVTTAYSESYNGRYLYTVQSNEDTKTST